jgi:hypothetical protein
LEEGHKLLEKFLWVEETACVLLLLRKFLTSSKVSLAVLLVLPEGMELRKAERSSSITADRLLSPRPLKSKTKSSLNVIVTFILRISINIPQTKPSVLKKVYTYKTGGLHILEYVSIHIKGLVIICVDG